MNQKSPMTLFFIAVILFAVMGGFGKIMTAFNHNEHMYIAASVLISQNNILYKDFAFLQTPYLPLLYSSVYQIFGMTSYFFLTGKLISFLSLIISALILYLLAWQVLQDTTLSLGITALYLLNTNIINPAAEVSNYILPVAFSFAAIYLFELSFSSHKLKRFFPVLNGLFLGLAVGSKLTYASIVLPFVLLIFLIPLISRHAKLPLKQWMFEMFLPWNLGLLLGLLPMIIFYLLDPEVFVFDNWGYHRLNTQWRFMTGYTDRMLLSSKVYFSWEIITKIENLLILIGIFFGAVVTLRNIAQAPKIIFRLILAFALFLTGLITAITPTPSFPQYYMLPISFLFILLVYAWSTPIKHTFIFHQKVLLGLVLLTLIYNGPFFLANVSGVRDRDNWSAIYIRDISLKIRDILREYRHDQNLKIGTLSPLFALESGLPIYEELATGPFLYRVGDLLTFDQRKRFKASSPSTVHALFHSDQPAAILVGFEGELDQPLIEYAIENKYQKIDIAGFKGELYLRP